MDRRRRVLRALAGFAMADLVAMVAVAGSGQLADSWGVAHADDRVGVVVIAMIVTYLLGTYAMRTPRRKSGRSDAH